VSFRDILTDAIRYWELRRIAYNAILLAIVVIEFVRGMPNSRAAWSGGLLQTLIILAVLANVAYCAAYVVDVVVQHSGFQAPWRRYRWILFALGVVFAGIIARFIAAGMFGVPA
jgi:hypothetical protein